MSKIICDVCGTSYPETATQCPICGSVRPVQTANAVPSEDGADGNNYTYVKGGRFSKSNVKKRNKAAQAKQYPNDEHESDDKKSTGLIILLAVLLVIIALLVVFVVLAALGHIDLGLSNPTETTGDTTPLQVPCTDLQLNFDQVTLEAQGDTVTILTKPLPLNTTDTVSFTSLDESVASVDGNGVVSYVGAGQTVIQVTCGDAQVQCEVICLEQETTIAPEEFRLSRSAISFEMEGFSWILYSGPIPMESIVWTTDNEAVAVVEDGVVTATGEGETTVYGEYAGNKISCKIVCDFSGTGASGEVTEDSGSSGTVDTQNLRIYSRYFFSASYYNDFSIDVDGNGVDGTLTLMLADSKGNEVEAAWSINAQPYVSLTGSQVKGLISGGTATVTATYNGQTYTCRIRVR